VKPNHPTARASKRSDHATKPVDREAEAAAPTPLPRRMAMSILSGLPTMPIGGSSPIDLLNGGAGTTPSTDPSATPVAQDPGVAPAAPEPATAGGDIHQNSPLNQATMTNLNSADSVENASSAQQVTPIQQGTP